MEPIIVEELARMLEDVAEERGRREGEQVGRREGEQVGRREGEEIGRRQAIVDLAEAYDIPLDERRRAWIASASLAELEQVRVALKRDRAWPALPRGVRPRNEGAPDEAPAPQTPGVYAPNRFGRRKHSSEKLMLTSSART